MNATAVANHDERVSQWLRNACGMRFTPNNNDAEVQVPSELKISQALSLPDEQRYTNPEDENQGDQQGILDKVYADEHNNIEIGSPSGDIQVGSRVEVLFEGEWYTGGVVDFGSEAGFWKVQCDADEEGVVTTSDHVRIESQDKEI